MHKLICTCILFTVHTQALCSEPTTRSQRSSQSHSPARLLTEALRKSDECLKKYIKNPRGSKENSPQRPQQLSETITLKQTAMLTAMHGSPASSPREDELSSSPKKQLATYLRRSNSLRYLMDARVSKENSKENTPRDEASESQTSTSEISLSKKEIELRKKLYGKISQRINSLTKNILAGKEKPERNDKKQYQHAKYLWADHFIYRLSYKNVEYTLHFIRHENAQIACFVNCPLLYES